ncbi:hypothetical protein V1291_003592 [Nitrobacteraceae bacterium AZCC 1564]
MVWPKIFEAFRRIVLSAGMLSVRGRIQREGEVVHIVAQQLSDLSAELASVGEREASFSENQKTGRLFNLTKRSFMLLYASFQIIPRNPRRTWCSVRRWGVRSKGLSSSANLTPKAPSCFGHRVT